jgi:amino acid transporter
MCISIASFAYVGVEIVAASALEVKPRQAKAADEETASPGQSLVSNTVKLSAVYIPVVVTIGYTLAGFLISLDMPRDDCALPRVEWAKDECPRKGYDVSVFVTIADKIPHMNHVFNVFVVLTAMTTASTNLYVASRSLFGLTSRIDGSHDDPWYLKICAYFGRTNSHKVPIRAVVFSALAFWWVPFLELIPDAEEGGSDGVAIVSLTSALLSS